MQQNPLNTKTFITVVHFNMQIKRSAGFSFFFRCKKKKETDNSAQRRVVLKNVINYLSCIAMTISGGGENMYIKLPPLNTCKLYRKVIKSICTEY